MKEREQQKSRVRNELDGDGAESADYNLLDREREASHFVY